MSAPVPAVPESPQSAREWAQSLTADGCVWGINAALEKRDMEGVAGFLKLLAVKDPHRAQDVLDAIDVARIVRAAGDPS